LFCWAFAAGLKRRGLDGRFMIRIEDTDQARSSEESARGILEDLAWLGIEWDDGPELRLASGRTVGGDPRGVGPFFQARRVPLYNAYVEDLVRRGRAYPAFESGEELETRRREAVAAKRTYRYERPADIVPGVFPAARWERAVRGESHVVRFVAPNEEIVVHDLVLGQVRIAAGELDDFVIRKADGFPTYHFAVVIDDELMGVTHVMRAQEHLANTPRHVALQRALVRLDPGTPLGGRPFRTPMYAHMPLIFNMDGSKMSKRDKARAARRAAQGAIAKGRTPESLAASAGVEGQALAGFLAGENDRLDVAEALARSLGVNLPEIEVWDFRRNGYLPEVITNFIALLGWSPGLKDEHGRDVEKFGMDFLAEHFSIERIGRTNARFDRAKLLAFNADAIRAMSDEEFARRWWDWMCEHEAESASAVRRRFGDDPPGSARFRLLARALRPRARTLRDALGPARFALVGDTEYEFEPAAVAGHLHADGGRGFDLVLHMRDRLATLNEDEFTPEMVHALAEQLARQTGAGLGAVSQALRVAVTGAGVSPGIGETLCVLGLPATLARLERALALRV
jgi:glutamyl-tRNA synthetase